MYIFRVCCIYRRILKIFLDHECCIIWYFVPIQDVYKLLLCRANAQSRVVLYSQGVDSGAVVHTASIH